MIGRCVPPTGLYERRAKNNHVVDLRGHRYGRLTIAENAKPIIVRPDLGTSLPRACWPCTCDCGATLIVPSNSLRRKNGGTRSCGCLRDDVRRVRASKERGSVAVVHHVCPKCSRWKRARVDTIAHCFAAGCDGIDMFVHW